MWERGLICLAIVVSICLAGVVFLPAGTGPYTAVYGPASALRAQRAVLLLALAISFLTTVSLSLAAFVSFLSVFSGPLVPFEELLSAVPLTPSLRC